MDEFIIRSSTSVTFLELFEGVEGENVVLGHIMILLGAVCSSVQGDCAVSARLELHTSWGFFHCSDVQINAITEDCQKIYSKAISEYQDYKTSPVLIVLPSSSWENYKRKQMSTIAK